jgi:predicted Zn-dependent protease
MNEYFNQMIIQNMDEFDITNKMGNYINQMIQNMNESDTAMTKTYANTMIMEYMKEMRNKK